MVCDSVSLGKCPQVMKKIIFFSVFIFTSILLNAQENWISFKDYPTDLVINVEESSDVQDTPFVFINREDEPHNYLLPVKLITESYDGIPDMDIKINSIAASYDNKGRLMIYFRGKIDMSCCYPSPIAIKFYDSKGNLIQIAKSDEKGNFKVKSINGNIIEISKGRIKFNFSKLQTFDGNADVRYAYMGVYKKPIDRQFESSQQAEIVNTQR